MRMKRGSSQLLIVDVQEKLLPAVVDPEALLAKITFLAVVAKRLDVPITISEHYPRGLGPTAAAIREVAGNAAVTLGKVHFSCMDDEGLKTRFTALKAEGRNQIVVAGMEAHVCVTQTALSLVDSGFETYLVADAITSRTSSSCAIAADRLRQAGCVPVATEMVMFEWLEKAGTAEFKDLLALIR